MEPRPNAGRSGTKLWLAAWYSG